MIARLVPRVCARGVRVHFQRCRRNVVRLLTSNLHDGLPETICPRPAELHTLHFRLTSCVGRPNTVAKAEEIWENMLKCGVVPNSVVLNEMLSIYGGAESWHRQDELLRKYSHLINNRTFTRLLKCCVGEEGGHSRAEKLVTAMKQRGLTVGEHACATLLDVFGNDWKKQDEVAKRHGDVMSAVAYGVLLKHCMNKEGGLERANRLWKECVRHKMNTTRSLLVVMLNLNARDWTIQDRLVEEHPHLLANNEVAFGVLLKHCINRDGGVARAEKLYAAMAKHGVRPNSVIVNTMLFVFGAAGDVERQDRFFKRHRSLVNAKTIRILLRHCVGREGGVARAEGLLKDFRLQGQRADVKALQTMSELYEAAGESEKLERLLKHPKLQNSYLRTRFKKEG